MALSPQSQAANILNQLNTIAQAWSDVIAQWGQISAQPDITSILAALPTCAINADGSLGSADSVSVSGHMIDTRNLAPGITLNRAATNTQYANLKAYINDIIQIMDTGPNNATIAPFVGG